MESSLLPIDVAVRLADEGVPLRAIARATKIPSNDLREQLHEAQTTGRLLDLPRDDWPPGFPRDQRALQLSRLVCENREAVLLAVQQVFGLTLTQAQLLMALVQSPAVSRTWNDKSARTMDVHVYNIRQRLNVFAIEIYTLWGFGFRLLSADRHKVMSLILHNIKFDLP